MKGNHSPGILRLLEHPPKLILFSCSMIFLRIAHNKHPNELSYPIERDIDTPGTSCYLHRFLWTWIKSYRSANAVVSSSNRAKFMAVSMGFGILGPWGWSSRRNSRNPGGAISSRCAMTSSGWTPPLSRILKPGSPRGISPILPIPWWTAKSARAGFGKTRSTPTVVRRNPPNRPANAAGN